MAFCLRLMFLATVVNYINYLSFFFCKSTTKVYSGCTILLHLQSALAAGLLPIFPLLFRLFIHVLSQNCRPFCNRYKSFFFSPFCQPCSKPVLKKNNKNSKGNFNKWRQRTKETFRPSLY